MLWSSTHSVSRGITGADLASPLQAVVHVRVDTARWRPDQVSDASSSGRDLVLASEEALASHAGDDTHDGLSAASVFEPAHLVYVSGEVLLVLVNLCSRR